MRTSSVLVYSPISSQWSSGRRFGMLYKLNADGTSEYGWQGQVTNYGCSTRGMVYRRGTATVSDSVKTLYDNVARVSGKDNRVASSNYDGAIALTTEGIILHPSVDEYGNAGTQNRTPITTYSWFRHMQ